MKQKFHHYKTWEDWKGGMFLPPKNNYIEEKMVNLSRELLSSKNDFYSAGIRMISVWKISSEVNLTNSSTNRRAWVGQATCCFTHGSSEESTKKAWWEMSEEEREQANKVADEIIKEWTILYFSNQKNYEQTSIGF